MALETSRFHWFWLSQVFATLDSPFGLNFDRFLEFGAWWSLHGSIWLETRETFLRSCLAGETWFYHCWFDEITKRCATLTGCDVKLCWRWLCRSRCLAWWYREFWRNGRNGHFQSFQLRPLIRCFRFRCPTLWLMTDGWNIPSTKWSHNKWWVGFFLCLEWVMKLYTFTRDISKIRCQHFIIREKGPASK